MQSRVLRAAGGGALGGLLWAGLGAAVSFYRWGGSEFSQGTGVLAVAVALGPVVGAITGAFVGFLVGRAAVWARRELSAAVRVLASVGALLVWSALTLLTRSRAGRSLWFELFFAVAVGVPAGLLARPKTTEAADGSAASGRETPRTPFMRRRRDHF